MWQGGGGGGEKEVKRTKVGGFFFLTKQLLTPKASTAHSKFKDNPNMIDISPTLVASVGKEFLSKRF